MHSNAKMELSWADVAITLSPRTLNPIEFKENLIEQEEE